LVANLDYLQIENKLEWKPYWSFFIWYPWPSSRTYKRD